MYQKDIMGQFCRYALVGGIASIVDVSVFSIWVDVFRINYIISNTISLTAGLAVNYLLSSKWVFNIRTHHVTNFFMFAAVGITGFALSNFLLFILIDFRVLYYLALSTNENLIKPSAKLIVTGVVLFWNFAARRKIVLS